MGNTSFDETTSYIKDSFLAKNKSPHNKTIFPHLTCATDQGNIDKVFNDVQHIIIENSLMSAGLMGDFEDDYDDDYGGGDIGKYKYAEVPTSDIPSDHGIKQRKTAGTRISMIRE